MIEVSIEDLPEMETDGFTVISVLNPANRLNTYRVTLVNVNTGEAHYGLTTHHYTMMDCQEWVEDLLPKNLRLARIEQPDTKQVVIFENKTAKENK